MIALQAVTVSPRWKVALRAGFVSYAIASLVIVLALAPFWAGQNEFPGHTHPPGTPDHTHLIQDVTGSLAAADVLSAVSVVVPLVLPALPLPAPSIKTRRLRGANLSRGPPPSAFF